MAKGPEIPQTDSSEIEILIERLKQNKLERRDVELIERLFRTIVGNQKDGRPIAPSRSSIKDLSVCGEVGDLTAVSGGHGKSDAHAQQISLSTDLLKWYEISAPIEVEIPWTAETLKLYSPLSLSRSSRRLSVGGGESR